MTLSRREAIDYLHHNKQYSRRLSAKLVDMAMDNNGQSALHEAFKKALEKNLEKKSKKPKVTYRYVVKK